MERLTFALFGNIYQAKKSVAMQKVLCQLERLEADVLVDRPFYEYLTQGLMLEVKPKGLIDGNDFRADYVISMGGDGTFLAAASRVADKRIPILGINMGHLGFLADVPADEIDQALTMLCEGRCVQEPHTVLQVDFHGKEPQGYPFALNEVAVLKRDNSSMICIRVDINGEYLATYQADGLIVNTPTGSTGYALSVGGPIMVPNGRVIGITPVAPHSLNVRPMALPDDVTVNLTIESRNHQFLVAIDGRSEACDESVRFTVRRASYDVVVVKRPGNTFFRTLRNKLMLGSDLRV